MCIRDSTDSGVKAYGPGLKNAVAEKPAVFTVDARNAKYPGAIGVGIEGPKEAAIDTKQNPDGTVAVTYFPTEQGEYTISVTYDDKPIKESPFKCKVRPSAYEKKPVAETDLSGVKVYGPGLNPEGNLAHLSLSAWWMTEQWLTKMQELSPPVFFLITGGAWQDWRLLLTVKPSAGLPLWLCCLCGHGR